MPGSTPTAVPSSTPITANIRFIGWTATASPCASAANVSTARTFLQETFDRPGRKAERQQLREHQIDEEAQAEPDGEVGGDVAAAHAGGGGREQDGDRRDEAAADADDDDQRRQSAENQDDGAAVE